jgi:hypothetical protein
VATGTCGLGPNGSCGSPFVIADDDELPASTVNADSSSVGSCTDADSDEVWFFAAPADGTVKLRLSSEVDATMYARSACDESGSEVACVDEAGGGDEERMTVSLAGGDGVFIVVDTFDPGVYELRADFFPVECGDDVFAAGFEQCEDGNVVDDACGSDCLFNSTQPEIEPNDDGTPSPDGPGGEGNDFDAVAVAVANANGPISADALVLASIANGDEDVFAVDNNSATVKIVRLSTQTPTCDADQSSTYNDTVIRVREANGIEIDSSDDIGASNLCSQLERSLEPGQRVYVHVLAFDDGEELGPYVLTVDFL